MIFEPNESKATFRAFRSKHHTLEQVEITKKLLTGFSDKVFYVSPSETRPLGHWRNTLGVSQAASSDATA